MTVRLPIARSLSSLREAFDERCGYLRFKTNWHKHPLVSAMLCSIGRHDFEFEGLVAEQPDWGVLRCFYCDHVRNSRNVERPRG